MQTLTTHSLCSCLPMLAFFLSLPSRQLVAADGCPSLSAVLEVSSSLEAAFSSKHLLIKDHLIISSPRSLPYSKKPLEVTVVVIWHYMNKDTYWQQHFSVSNVLQT